MVLNDQQLEKLRLFSHLIEDRLKSPNLSEKDRTTIIELRQKMLSTDAPETTKIAIAACLSHFDISIDAKDQRQETALMRAVRANQHDLIKLLKALGADINVQDQYAETPIMLAIQQSPLNTETIELLVNLGANLSIKNALNETALSMAIRINHPALIFFLQQALKSEQPETLKFDTLLPSSEPTQASKIERLKALLETSVLSSHDKKEIDELLSSGGVDPNILLGPDNVPALIYALRKGNVEAANILLAHNADKKCLSELHPPGNKSLLCELEFRTLVSKTLSPKAEMILHFLCDNDVNLRIGNITTSPMTLARRSRNQVFIKALSDYLNTKNTTLFKELYEDPPLVKTIKDAGHVLGFTSIISNIKTTGYEELESATLLKRYLDNLSVSDASPLLKKHYLNENSLIKEALNLAIRWSKVDGQITHQDFIDHHASGSLTILQTGWDGHAITLVAWNDVLIICNRGEGQLENCISVFKIPEPGKLTKKFLEQIMPETGTPYMADVMQGIHSFVDIKNPILSFPSHAQKHGTCSFVNLKSSLLPILCFAELLDAHTLSENPRKFDSKFLSELNSAHLQSVMHEAQKDYKAFTNDMRNQKVNELCNTFQNLSVDSPERSLYLSLFQAILKEHHGQGLKTRNNKTRIAKMGVERKRAEQILGVLTPLEKKKVLSELLSDQNKQSILTLPVEWLMWLMTYGQLDTPIANPEIKVSENAENEQNPVFTPMHMHLPPSTATVEFKSVLQEKKAEPTQEMPSTTLHKFKQGLLNTMRKIRNPELNDSVHTKLIAAMKAKDLAKFKLLITTPNLDLNAIQEFGTLLRTAAADPVLVDYLKILLAFGADPNIKVDGLTLVGHAVANYNSEGLLIFTRHNDTYDLNNPTIKRISNQTWEDVSAILPVNYQGMKAKTIVKAERVKELINWELEKFKKPDRFKFQ